MDLIGLDAWTVDATDFPMGGRDSPNGSPTQSKRTCPGINRFVNGVNASLDAVTAGLSLDVDSRPVEHNANRKTLKRQPYGRTSFDLLRKRVRLAI